MPTAILRAGDVFAYQSSPTIVGSGAIWSDDSDATYAISSVGSTTASSTSHSPGANVDLLTSSATGIISVSVHMRYEATNSDVAQTQYAAWEMARYGEGPDVGYKYRETVEAPASTPTDLDFQVFPQDWMTPADVAARGAVYLDYLTTGTRINFWAVRNMPASATLTVYEAWLTVAYEGGPSVAPPLRQYPRSDGLATSSARRMWPPSRSYQRGIRRAGGYL